MATEVLTGVMLLICVSSVMTQRSVMSLAVATQSSTKVINGEPQSADKALDGSTDVKSFAETKAGDKNWIRIDLRNVFKISAICIKLGRRTFDRTVLEGFSVDLATIKGSPRCVFMTDDTANDTEYMYANYTPYGILLTNKTQFMPDSRYITLRRDILPLKVYEITVFGDCPDNYCGVDCTEYCSCSKPLSWLEKMSNESFTCDGECLPGWTGERCNTSICPERKFGYRCFYNCHCRYGCDPRTGECLGPDRECIVGWYGPSCQMLNTFPYKMFSYNANVTDGSINTCVPAPKSGMFIITLPNRRILNHVRVTVRQVAVMLLNIETRCFLCGMVWAWIRQLPLERSNLSPHCSPHNAIHQTECAESINCLNVWEYNESYEDIQLQLLPKERPNNCVKHPVETELCDGVNKLLFLCHEVDIQALDFRPITGSLCEIEFLGCASRSFGPDCNFRCHCVADYCNNVDGSCIGEDACLPGWHGVSCNTSCPRGFYGKDCKQICDRCANDETCHHITGECREPYEHEEKTTMTTEAEITTALIQDLNKDCNCTDGSLSPMCDSSMNCSSTGQIDRKGSSAKKDPSQSDGVLHVILPVIGGLVTIGIIGTIIIVWRRRKSKNLHQSEYIVPVAVYDLPDHRQSNTGAAYVALSENRTGPAYAALSEQLSGTTYETLSENRVGPIYEGLSEQRTGATYESLSEERKETTYSKISDANEVAQGNDYLDPRQSYMVPGSKSVTADYIEMI